MWRIATAAQLAQAEAQRSLLQARNEAEAANRAKSDFLANMSHEIRTPMNGVLGMAQVMAAGDLGKIQRERLDVIRQSGETLLAILNDLLDLSKIESGKLALEEVEFDIADLARSVQATFSALAQQKGLAFDLAVEPSAEGGWRGDPTRVSQILYNLASNALKFTDAGGIAVTVRRSDDVLEIIVRDTGVGMSAETLGGLFEKFVQADASTTRRYGGTGLGLSICRELARLMGGDISAESELGRGSVFTVRLRPTWLGALAGGPGETPRDGEDAPSRQRSHLHLLVAEDHPTNRLVLKALLSHAGMDPTFVENGQACIEAWEAGAWDAILMDVRMPVMDGPAAARAIRVREAATGRARTPIIALTANAMAHEIAACLEAGMDGHVSKPIETARLLEAIAAALDPETARKGAVARA
jgi:CheY-like chemotaxis protein